MLTKIIKKIRQTNHERRWKTAAEMSGAGLFAAFMIIYYYQSGIMNGNEAILGYIFGIASISVFLFIIAKRFSVWRLSAINTYKNLRGTYEIVKADAIEHFNIFRKQ